MTQQNLTLPEICSIINKDWKNMNPYAREYFNAMQQLDSVNDNYYMDSGKSIVLYFLSNASSWRGETAREIKKLLNKMCK